MIRIQRQQRSAQRMARASQAGVKAALNREAELARDEQLPSRFESGSPVIKPRATAWDKAKRRMAKAKPGKFQSGRDNVFTGGLERAAKSAQVSVTETEAVVTVVSPHPVASYQVNEIMRPTSGERKRQIEAALQQLYSARRSVPVETVRV